MIHFNCYTYKFKQQEYGDLHVGATLHRTHCELHALQSSKDYNPLLRWKIRHHCCRLLHQHGPHSPITDN